MMTAARTCGECVACCKVLKIDVPEFHKPEGVLCQHCSSHGCGIYQIRYDVCRGFFCVWRQHADLEDGFRPDRLGILLQAVREPDSPNILRRSYIYAIPLERFFDYGTPRIKAALDKLRELRTPVWIRFGDAMTCVHPSREIQALLLEGRDAPNWQLQGEVVAWRSALDPSSNAGPYKSNGLTAS